MAMIVRREHDLPTLRIAPARGTQDVVRLTAARGRDDEVEVATRPARDLGPFDRLAAGEPFDDGAFRLPGDVLDRVARAVDAMGPSPSAPENALWLEFPSPRGYLYLLPWEALLAPLARPVIRLPNSTVRPQAPASVLEVALCGSSPPARTGFDAPRELDRLTRVWIRHPAHEVHVHLFPDAAAVPALRAGLADLGARVRVHDPAEGSDGEWAGATGAAASNPWLEWMCSAMQGQAIDVVHVLGHGYLAGDRGAVALASDPSQASGRMPSRFVGAAELSSYLSQQGAWSLLLAGPPGNASPAALRELADAVALSHAGVTLVHELSADPDLRQLKALLALVYGGGASEVAMPGVTCWVHPQFVAYPPDQQGALLLTPEGTSSLIRSATHEALADEYTPTWVASGTRYLESLQAQWLPETPDEAVDQDAVAALQSVSDLLERHARRHLDERGAS